MTAVAAYLAGPRALGRLALVVPLCGAALLAAAVPASAAIVTPGAGATYTSDTTVAVRADVPQSSTASTLKLEGPGVARQLAASTNRDALGNYPAQSLTGSLDTDCATADCNPGQVKPARNGTWRVTLSGAQSDSNTFVLRIPPKAPTAVSASTTAFREITVKWQRGSEPDLTGFTLYDNAGAVMRSDISMSACSAGGACSTALTYGDDDSGERTFKLRAHRSTAPNSTDVLDSRDSGSAAATLADKPPPAPSPEPTTDPGSTGAEDPGTGGEDPGTSTSGGSGGTTSGGSTSGGSTTGTGGSSTTGSSTSGGGGDEPSNPTAIGTGSKSDNAALNQRRAFALTFRAFAPKLGINKLPPLAQVQAPVVGEAPLPDGEFEGTLEYGDQDVQEKYEILGSKRIGGAVSGALDSEQFMRFIAAALIMLLTAAHLRRWLGATSPVQE